ncbi:ABC transporter permease [Psychromicrobium xiongbiense]|uniref:ABC transporter permease n=1 Tax=Psychromicrobium xiongbiense TaxID=3051184 RepID=UPI002555454D|nr:ABC transporter permease [Psychromicrobium sp. YIM S02556]
MTGFIAALVGAWGEFRVQKTRVLLSLVGVALSVAALTAVVGIGDLMRAGITQNQEKWGGRTATLQLYIGSDTGTPIAGGQEKIDQVLQRYGLKDSSSTRTEGQAQFQFVQGVAPARVTLVDPPYGTIHRVTVSRGQWFAADDAQRLAPAMVVNESFYSRMGRPDLQRAPEVGVIGETPVTAILIGVVPDADPSGSPAAYLLRNSPAAGSVAAFQGGVSQEIWVDPQQAARVSAALQSDLAAAFPGAHVNINRSDFAAQGDPFAIVQWGAAGVAILVMFLGVLSLLNITMVTIRHRVREIGIRRSFGATGSRVFFSVMLESVVATTAAGILGVMLAIAVVKNPWIESKIGQGLTEYPPFPLSAALLGLGAAVLAGVIAGLLPAIVAVRIKVIDAIRF